MAKNGLLCSSGGQIHEDGVTTVGHLICDSGLFFPPPSSGCWRHIGVCAYAAKLLKNTLYWIKGHFLEKQRTLCVQLGTNRC